MEFYGIYDLVNDLYFFVRYRNKEERRIAKANEETKDLTKAERTVLDVVVVLLILLFTAFVVLMVYVAIFK